MDVVEPMMSSGHRNDPTRSAHPLEAITPRCMKSSTRALDGG
jgi:hypothetical protein